VKPEPQTKPSEPVLDEKEKLRLKKEKEKKSFS
jgi:hypothetical protein